MDSANITEEVLKYENKHLTKIVGWACAALISTLLIIAKMENESRNKDSEKQIEAINENKLAINELGATIVELTTTYNDRFNNFDNKFNKVDSRFDIRDEKGKAAVLRIDAVNKRQDKEDIKLWKAINKNTKTIQELKK